MPRYTVSLGATFDNREPVQWSGRVNAASIAAAVTAAPDDMLPDMDDDELEEHVESVSIEIVKENVRSVPRKRRG